MNNKMNDESTSGIYKISNRENGKTYIGSAVNLKKRKRKHFNALKKNNHYNQYLQNEYNKFGDKNFIFETIELCSKKDLIKKEQKWIDVFYDYQDQCYNILLKAGSSLGYKHSRQSLSKQSKALKGRKHSKETKEKISKSNKAAWEENPQRRNKLVKMRTGKSNPFYGKKHKTEHKNKISKALKGKKKSKATRQKLALANKKPVVQLTLEGKVVKRWDSALDASISTGINRSTIGMCCKGFRKTSGGYKWKYNISQGKQ